MRWAGYRRVSRVGDRGRQLISPELQEQRILGYAAARGFEVEMLPAELDVSGARVVRPVLERAIERVEAGELRGIIVSQVNRLSRMKLSDALGVFERIEGAGGDVIAVAENIDASTPEGDFARNFFLSMAKMERDRSSNEFARSKRHAVEAGIWPTNTPPIGYRRGPGRGLIPSDDAPRVLRAFEARAGGASWGNVGEILGRGPSGAAKVVGNRVYLGELRLRLKDGEVVNDAAHESLVSRALWESAQLERTGPGPPSRTAVLSGLVRCAGCGCRMSSDFSGKTAVYRCRAQKSGWRCPEPAIISQRLIDPLVERSFLAHAAALSFAAEDRTDILAEAEGKLEAAEAELVAYQEAVNVSELGRDLFARGMRKRAEAVEGAGRELGDARTRTVDRLRGDIGSIWPGLSVEERRHFLRGSLGIVWVRRGRLQIAARVRLIARGFEPVGLPEPGFIRRDRFILPWDADLDGEIRVLSPEVGDQGLGGSAL
jgi:site-specific DNA recombinase